MIPPLVSVQWLHDHLDNPGVVILNATQPHNQAGLSAGPDAAGIPGTRLVDLENDFSDPGNPLPHMLPAPAAFTQPCRRLGLHPNHHLVVYDNLGIYWSPRVWWMFTAMGHENISVLDGGLPAWTAAGYATEPARRDPFPAGTFTARSVPAAVSDARFVQDNLSTRRAVLIDARPEGRFNGQVPEPRQGL
ncbi:MAG TPA: rhodanese-like domain-containing protein, partial [Cytophagales bacterium]